MQGCLTLRWFVQQCPDKFPTVAPLALTFPLVHVAMSPAAAFSHLPDGFQSAAVLLTKRPSAGGRVTCEVNIQWGCNIFCCANRSSCLINWMNFPLQVVSVCRFLVHLGAAQQTVKTTLTFRPYKVNVVL